MTFYGTRCCTVDNTNAAISVGESTVSDTLLSNLNSEGRTSAEYNFSWIPLIQIHVGSYNGSL
jgi:hypothetical protein